MRQVRQLCNTLRRHWRWSVAILAVALLLILGVGVATQYVRSHYHFGAAQQAIDKHDLDEAQSQLRSSLGVWPNNAHAHLLAVQTARRRNAYAEAERLLTQYQHDYGSTAPIDREWLLLGVQQGDFAGQERELQWQAEMGHADAPLILEAMAKGHLSLFRPSDAVAACDLLLEQQPNFAPALVLRAQGFKGLSRYDRALEDYKRAVDSMPNSGEARLGFAEMLAKAGRPREAICQFELLRRQEASNAAVLLGLARCRFENQELDQAQRLLDVLLQAHPDHSAALVERGRQALCRDRVAMAEADLSRAVAVMPWHREARRLLLHCLNAQGKSEEADTCQQHWQELQERAAEMGRLALRYRQTPHDAALRHQLAMWCLNNGEERAGIRWLFGALLVDPGHGPTHAALADYFERTGQPRRSARHRQRAG